MEIRIVDEYRTKDLGEAGALIVKGKQLLKIERLGKVCWFIFQDRESCQVISKQFFFGDLQVNALNYFEALGRLKNRIFMTI